MNIDPVPEWLRVSRGDRVEARHLTRMADLVESRTYFPGDGVQFTQVPRMGTIISQLPKTALLVHPWMPTRRGGRIVIRPGLVNLLTPYLDGRRLDGLSEEGDPLPEGPPALRIDPDLYDEEGRSWGCLRARVDPETGRLLEPADGGLTIVQVARLSPDGSNELASDGGSPDDGTGGGLAPLFILKRPRESRSLGTAVPYAQRNIAHRWVAGGDGRRARHFFWAA